MTWFATLVVVAAIIVTESDSTANSVDLRQQAGGVRAPDSYAPDRSSMVRVKHVASKPGSHAEKASSPGSIWPRLIHSFALPADQPHPVRVELERLTENPRNVERILERGAPYLHYILNEVQERGLPSELALLPVIESAFDPFARSPQLATGLWQFVSATAEEFDLQLDGWYDERRDLMAGTSAALDLLTQLHRRFDRNWLLALAAYNAGPTRVQRAMVQNRDAGKPAEFWDLDLPEETRSYVPKLLAIRAVLKAPSDYGLRLPTIRDEPVLQFVEVHGPLDLGVAARLAGVTLEEMHRLNAVYSRRAVRQDRPIRLVVPRSTAADFTVKLASLADSEREPWIRHRIRFGDTLSDIARYYDVPLGRLREFNRLPDSRIIAGDVLIIPANSG